MGAGPAVPGHPVQDLPCTKGEAVRLPSLQQSRPVPQRGCACIGLSFSPDSPKSTGAQMCVSENRGPLQ